MIDWNPVAEKFREADAILIGASNGLSITEGLHLFADNAVFERLFGDFKRKYDLECILQGMMAGWSREEEKWAFWARLIHHYCGQYQPTSVMNDLKAIVGEKDYFVVTSNGEGHFELCGFDPTKIYEIEGNWFTMQCARPCHDTLYMYQVAEKLSAAEQGGHVPTELVPRCPKCGGPMDIHMGAGQRMIPDTAAQARFQNFLKTYHGKKLVVLELGTAVRSTVILTFLCICIVILNLLRNRHASHASRRAGSSSMAEVKESSILIQDVETKNIMTKSTLPVGGYSVNPYVGCTPCLLFLQYPVKSRGKFLYHLCLSHDR